MTDFSVVEVYDGIDAVADAYSKDIDISGRNLVFFEIVVPLILINDQIIRRVNSEILFFYER